MHLADFVNSRKQNWEEFRALLHRAGGAGISRISTDEIDRFVWLYRGITNDLAKARAVFPGTNVEEDLNALAAQGYSLLYSNSHTRRTRIYEFLLYSFPRAVRRNWRFMAASFAILFVFSFTGLFLERIDPRLPGAVVPDRMMNHFRTELEERGRVDRDISFDRRSVFSSMLIANNVRVSFAAFALGVTFGAGTVYILAVNGLMLGCLGNIFAGQGSTVNYLAFIMPHGVVELTAIVISGGAGLMLGYALLNPGGRTRGEALKQSAGEAVELVAGIAAMLVFAGFIEAFITPIMWIPDEIKLVFSAALFAVTILYLAKAGKRTAGSRTARIRKSPPSLNADTSV